MEGYGGYKDCLSGMEVGGKRRRIKRIIEKRERRRGRNLYKENKVVVDEEGVFQCEGIQQLIKPFKFMSW